MKKYIITVAVFAACLALCAAVWPQSDATEETSAPLQVTAVSAPEPTVEDIAAEAETTLPTEKEKAEIPLPQAEPIREVTHEAEPVPGEMVSIPEVQPTSEPDPVYPPEPTSAPAPSQTVADPQPGDMLYVPGFGWLETQEPGEVIHDESIYENGNKIGAMG